MIDDINELVPAMRQKVVKTIQEAAKIGYELRAVETYRTSQRQAELYAQGRTTPGSIVTNAKPGESLHEKRRAVDFVDRQKGYDIDWQAIANLAKKQGLVWGGSFGDNPHFEYHGPESEEEVTLHDEIRIKIDGLYEALFNREPGEGDAQAILDRASTVVRLIESGVPKHEAMREIFNDIVSGSNEFKEKNADILG